MSGRTDSESIEVAVNSASLVACETAAPRLGAVQPIRDFALTLEWRSSRTAVLVLAGELDLYRAPEIEQALADAIGAEPHSDRRKPVSDDGPSADGSEIRAGQVRRVAVDLRSVTFIDSTTLAMLLAASRRQQAQRGELLVLVGPQTPMTAFEVTGFDRLLAIRRVDDMTAYREPRAKKRRRSRS
jgi:anti-anti-sigma regulatory factor